jgi:hypothetical protein
MLAVGAQHEVDLAFKRPLFPRHRIASGESGPVAISVAAPEETFAFARCSRTRPARMLEAAARPRSLAPAIGRSRLLKLLRRAPARIAKLRT